MQMEIEIERIKETGEIFRNEDFSLTSEGTKKVSLLNGKILKTISFVIFTKEIEKEILSADKIYIQKGSKYFLNIGDEKILLRSIFAKDAILEANSIVLLKKGRRAS